jgi:hypothetical protein
MARGPAIALAALCVAGVGVPMPVPAAETTLDIVATGLRSRGYTCAQPASAEPDPSHSVADERAWILTCETGRYRVIFKGDTGARVEELGG